MIDRRSLLAAGSALAALPLPAWASPAFDLFDAHAHLVSDDLANFPRLAESGAGGDEAPARVEAVLSWMSAAGVGGGACVQHRATYGYDNSYLLACADAHKGALAPVVALDAQDAATPRKLRDLTRAHGLAGVRLTGPAPEDYSEQWLDSEAALATWAAADELGLLVDLTGARPPMDRVAALAERFSGCEVVVDAANAPAATSKRLFFKITGGEIARMSAPAAQIRGLADRLGAERLCWGSDAGVAAATYGGTVESVVRASALLTPAERRMVLGATGRRLYRRRSA